MKRLIIELTLVTTPKKEEVLYVYLVAEMKAVSAVLLTERMGKQCPVHYVSITLNEAERNYAPMEKLALSLLHMSQRLRRYFEDHPIKVITDQPIKQILNKAQASGKLAKYSVELGAYNITYKPRNATKGKVLADFLSEAPVDGASNSKGSRADLVLISPSDTEFTYALRLNFTRTNNEAEYEALLTRLRMATKMKKVDVLSKLATVASDHLTKEVLVEVLSERSIDTKVVSAVVVEEEDNWMTPIIKCLEEGVWLKNKNEARALRKRLINMSWREVFFSRRDTWNEIPKCDSCQIHAPVPKLPKTLMTSIMAPWTFYQWGMDILGPLPQSAGKVKFVRVAIDYFTKWIKAKPLARITRKEVKRFVWDNIVCRFGLQRIIVTDNITQFVNDPFKSWCEKFNIQQMNTVVAHPQANSLVERAKKSLMEGIKMSLGRDKSRWVNELPNVLWAHRTSLKQSNGETPFSLLHTRVKPSYRRI
ncbi:reverse transcriptase domain-containing protein [Tanacetum coccineum]